MSERYDHRKIEKKWQQRWKESQIFRVEDSSAKPKTYVLDMFPYPSGEGLHVGHPKGYIATDIYSRFKRMQGHNVLHPMGWDAFGLPAENFAIKNKIHPRIAVEKNISNFKEQLSHIGFDYDWSREINTTDPAYYKWTQWIFLQIYKKGLAFQSNEPINWCPSCMTGLANEDLDGNVCERCDTPVEKKTLPQWVLKITDYADRMLADLDTLNWPEHIKTAQRNWIGRKEGVVVSHKLIGSNIILDTFSAYPAWLYADTYIVIAPEHPMVKELVKGTTYEAAIKNFVQEIGQKSDIEREGAKEKLGVFTGRYAENPFRKGEQMPVWLANFALMDFGTGIIRCSSHDERDIEFAQKYDIPLRWIVGSENTFVNAHDNTGVLKDSGPFTGREITPELIQEMVEWMVQESLVTRRVTYKLKDWVFSRQRYWGEPIPIIHCPKHGAVAVPEDQLPVLLPEVESYKPSGTGESPLANITEWVNTTCPTCGGPAKRETNTMPQWAGSSWYYLRFMDPHNADALVGKDKETYWAPVDVYVGGDHAVRHLIYARFWHKFLYDIGMVTTIEPFARLEFLGFILAEDGKKMSKRLGNVINPTDVVRTYGADSFRIYEMFMGPFENTVAWNTASIAGTTRFVERVWRLADTLKASSVTSIADEALETIIHQTAKKVGEDIEAFKFNTAVSQLMVCLNAMEKVDGLEKEQWKTFLRLLAPFAPHVAEELWERLGEPYSVHTAPWPQFDESKLVAEKLKIAIQINGKVRGSIEIAPSGTQEDVLATARANPVIAQWLSKGSEAKVVYVPGKIISFVVE